MDANMLHTQMCGKKDMEMALFIVDMLYMQISWNLWTNLIWWRQI